MWNEDRAHITPQATDCIHRQHMTFDQSMHRLHSRPLTGREYSRIMRRFRKGMTRAMLFGLFLLPLHVTGSAAGSAQGTLDIAFALLAATVSVMFLVSMLGMGIAWAKRPRRQNISENRNYCGIA